MSLSSLFPHLLFPENALVYHEKRFHAVNRSRIIRGNGVMFCKTTAYFRGLPGSPVFFFFRHVILIAAENADAPPRKASVFKLVHKHAHERTYAGEVSYAKTADISFESKGRLTYVAPLGKYVQCEVLNRSATLHGKGIFWRVRIRISRRAMSKSPKSF